MAFEAGTYYIRNHKSSFVVDLHGGDHKTLIGFPFHGQENQQWELGSLGDGWYIRSIYTGSYFNLEKSLGDGAPITTNQYPASWLVEPTEESNVFRILWPNTNYTVDLDGSKRDSINLRSHAIGQPQQLWQLERVPIKVKHLEAQEPDANAIEDGQGGVSTSTITTTSDKVTMVTTTITVKTAINTQRW